MPRRLAGNASVRMAAVLAMNIAPPNACTMRKPMSHSAPWVPRYGSRLRAIDAAVNTTNPRL